MTDLDAPLQLADMAPRRRGRWLFPLLVGLAAVVLTGGVAAFALSRDDGPPPAVAATGVPLLTDEQTCDRAFPLMQRVTDLLVTWTGSDPPAGQLLGRLRQDLAELINVSPEPLRTDLGYQRRAVVDAISGVAPGPNLPTSTSKILAYCKQFGS